MRINHGGRHLYQSSTYDLTEKVVKVRRKGKSSYGDQIWELTLASGSTLRTAARSAHPFQRNEDFPSGLLVRLTVGKAYGTIQSVSFL